MDNNIKKIQQEIRELRMKKLGLTIVSTKKVFDTLLDCYKETLINAPRGTIDYSICISICDFNGYNRLGKVEELYNKWGDNYFIDLNNSVFLGKSLDSDGNVEYDSEINFKDIPKLQEIINIQFSLKEIIEMCQEYNVRIKLFSKDDDVDESAIEIDVNESFNSEEKNIKIYLDSVM